MSTVQTEPPLASTAQPQPKPTYLGLLNEIAEAERRGCQYLTAWADRCTDPEVEAALRTVAAREGEHSATFVRRVVELGYREADAGDRPDIFDNYFQDHTIDPATGALLGRFIAEERDSGRILRAARDALAARVDAGR